MLWRLQLSGTDHRLPDGDSGLRILFPGRYLSRSSSTFLRVSVRLIPIFLRLSPIPSPSVQRGSKDSIGI